jgi:hypothetical protein
MHALIPRLLEAEDRVLSATTREERVYWENVCVAIIEDIVEPFPADDVALDDGEPSPAPWPVIDSTERSPA